ncbi:MAG TPA: hypothetical protein VJL78_02890, partial [Candidatus Nitrosocosmicus sp.]|nr:hypothetical protein [Candidatus Nitrosocosmicus sp.]
STRRYLITTQFITQITNIRSKICAKTAVPLCHTEIKPTEPVFFDEYVHLYNEIVDQLSKS